MIQMKNVTFGFDQTGTNLFDAVNIQIDVSWKLGLVGRNGRGKTTLLQLLMGQFAYAGTITHDFSFQYFPQKIQDATQLTYFVLQTFATFEQWEIERELTLLQVDLALLWRPFESLSGGEQTKVQLAAMFVDDQHFSLLDEPTNHLDHQARQQIADYLQQKKQGFIVVSHDRHFLDLVTDHILSIEKSQLRLYQGNFSTYEKEKQLRDQFEMAQNEKLKKEIQRLKQTAAKKSEWAQNREGDKMNKRKGFVSNEERNKDKGQIGADAARTMKRAKAMLKRTQAHLSEKEQLLKDIEYIEPLQINYQPGHHQLLLQVENLQLFFDDKPLFAPISFELYQGQRLAIQGRNGSGKSSLIAYLLGTFQGDATGQVIRPQHLRISTVRQNYEINQGFLPDFAEQHALAHQDLLYYLKKLGVERNVFDHRIEQMSMGQRKRVELAKSLMTPAELFVWDEPLNYLDVFNQIQLEEMIQNDQPTMLIVEHDAAFLQNIATDNLILQ